MCFITIGECRLAVAARSVIFTGAGFYTCGKCVQAMVLKCESAVHRASTCKNYGIPTAKFSLVNVNMVSTVFEEQYEHIKVCGVYPCIKLMESVTFCHGTPHGIKILLLHIENSQ